jgi:hypothetical protein
MLAARLITGAPAHAQNTSPVPVSLSPAMVQVVNGQTVDVAVTVSEVTDLYAFNITLTYDPTVVEVVDADPTLDGVQAGLGLFLEPGFVLRNAADNTAGTLRFALTQLNPSPAKSGSGHLIVIKLRGKQLSGGSPLNLTLAELAQRDGTLLATTPSGGHISVGAAEVSPTGTPLPTQGAGTPMPTGTLVEPTMAPTQPATPTSPPSETVVPPATANSAAASTTPGLVVAPATSTLEASLPEPVVPTATLATSPGLAAAATQPGTVVAAVLTPAAAPAATRAAEAAPPSSQPARTVSLLLLGSLAAVALVVGLGALLFAAAKRK